MAVSKVGYGFVAKSGKHEMHVGEYGIVMSCTADARSATYSKMREAVSKFAKRNGYWK